MGDDDNYLAHLAAKARELASQGAANQDAVDRYQHEVSQDQMQNELQGARMAEERSMQEPERQRLDAQRALYESEPDEHMQWRMDELAQAARRAQERRTRSPDDVAGMDDDAKMDAFYHPDDFSRKASDRFEDERNDLETLRGNNWDDLRGDWHNSQRAGGVSSDKQQHANARDKAAQDDFDAEAEEELRQQLMKDGLI